ncbi:MAG: putative Ig domain-containing protein [Acidobacteria bacterium]|nr:putative Ig domain-containing protein [Acidobacteriota bacterium]
MLIILLLALGLCAPLYSQVAGPNINMVTGDLLGSGDPFLQRQNEPSIAVSSRSTSHLMAVANDYRLVDVPGLLDGSDEIGDVWLGIFRSTDGGASWKSAVLPGCPYNIPSCTADPSSPINRRMAAADGTIRPGPNGMFLMNGIAFDRGKNATSDIFVTRFMDLNNKENGNPFAYLDTIVIDSGTSGQFLDKPWIATALVPGTTRTCSVGGANGVPPQTFPAFDVYLVYAKFTGSSTKPSSAIMFTKSEDCGKTWSKSPVKLSESNSFNQGTALAVNPLNGDVHVAWRRSASSSDTDAILVTKWTRATDSWIQPAKVAVTLPADSFFDQPKMTGSALAFRAKAFPTMTVDHLGRVYLAWPQRGLAPAPFESNARIVVATSSDGINFPVAQQRVADPYSAGGHQLMPSITFAGGRLMLVYYDSRDSQTYGRYTALGGGEYREERVRVGDPNKPFTGDKGRFVMDDRTLPRLHTVDLRGVQAIPASAGAADISPSFGASFRISQYQFGKLPLGDRSKFPDGNTPQVAIQLQYNPPNFPMFARGTASFIGDYVEVAGPVYLPKTGGGWEYNLTNSEFAIFHAAWADNRNVRPPKLPATWQNYTPVASAGGVSSYDSSQSRPSCLPGQEGMRNQDIYSARISGGLLVTALGNQKPLSASISRAYSVLVQNQTRSQKIFRLDITNQPSPSGTASFLFSSDLRTLYVVIAPRSSVSRTVFIQSSNAKATVKVAIVEVAAVPPSGGSSPPLPGGLQSSVALNPDIVNPDIVNPDIVNPDIVNPDIVVAESYNPDIVAPIKANPDIVNPDIVNPDIVNPDIVNPDIVNPDIVNPDIVNPDIVNPDIVNPDIVNPDIVAADISAGYSDTIWSVKNIGNTAASYLTKLFSRDTLTVCSPGQTTGCVKLQLFLKKGYRTNTAGVGGNACKLGYQLQNQLVTIVNTPQFTMVNNLPDPSAVTDPSVSNPTLALQPGEEAQLVLRSFGGFDPRNIITPVVVAQAPKGANAIAPITLTITNPRLPDGRTGQPYSALISTIGSVSTLTFSVIPSGGLPNGLSLNPATGAITGTLTAPTGIYAFTIQAQEDPPLLNGTNLPLRIATQPFTIRVVDTLSPPAGTTLPPAALNQPYSAAINVSGGLAPFTFTLAPGSSLPTGLSLNSSTGIISGVPTAGGNFTFTIEVRDSSCTAQPCAPQLVAITLAIVVDGTPPTVIPSLLGTAGANGWYTSQVSLTWAISDPESGIKTTSSGCANALLTATTTITCTATNNAGLPTTTTRQVNIDTTAPVITPTVAGTLGNNGWYRSNVTVSWTVTDSESGLQPYTCPPTTLTSDTNGATVSCTATNMAGLQTIQSVTVKIDRTAPLIVVTAPLDGAAIPVNTSITAAYACSDALSTIASCIGTVPAGTSFTVTTTGPQTFTITATDQAGNTAVRTIRYNGAYQFNGYMSPLQPAGSFSGTSNLGQAVPLKWELRDGQNNLISDLSTTIDIRTYYTGPRNGTTPCSLATAGPVFVLYLPTIGATGGSTFRVSNGQYTFNWDTSTGAPTGSGCYTVAVQLSDGSAPKVTSVELR